MKDEAAAKMHNPSTILAMLDEMDAAYARAQRITSQPTDFTLAERLDVHRGVDHAAANRFRILAQAYRELAAGGDYLVKEAGK